MACLEHLWFPIKHRIKKALLKNPLHNLSQDQFDTILRKITKEAGQQFSSSCMRGNYRFILQHLE